MQLTSTELAAKLGVSKGRVSQYVSGGQLAGCFVGDGRDRRFDLEKCLEALGKRLDPGQMLGNGAQTRRALRDLAEAGEDLPRLPPPRVPQRPDTPLGGVDPDRYELARAAKAEEDLRAMRLRNGREEGLYVLTSEVAQATARIVAQEVSEMETVLREGARAVADRLGVDARQVRQILTEIWREYRAKRSAQLVQQAEAAGMTEAEREADI